MINDSKISGFAILTDPNANIIELVKDDIGIKNIISEKQSFISLIDKESKDKALQFLNTLRYQKVAFDWELNIKIEHKITHLSFAGVALANSFLIMGSTIHHDVEVLYEELIRINNEQTNILRKTVKENIEKDEEIVKRDNLLYEEFSRTNNELTNIQRELTKKNIELESLNQQKNKFLGMASHDLRTPLSTILTYSEFLIEEANNLKEEQIKFIEIIKASSYFMLTLIDDLLDISKIESGNINMELSKANLVYLIENNISINKIIANKKHINIISVFDKNLPELFIDIGKIDQVLNNLISNAIKFSFPDTNIEIRAEYKNKNVLISVKDEGQGIPENEIERLFKYFTKTSVRSTAGEKSSGLGLAIVKKIIDEHKGKIWVESQVNKGSTFFVMLPV